MESAPWADCDPISSWSNSIIMATSELSLAFSRLLNSIKASREIKEDPRLSSLGDETNSWWRPTRPAG